MIGIYNRLFILPSVQQVMLMHEDEDDTWITVLFDETDEENSESECDSSAKGDSEDIVLK